MKKTKKTSSKTSSKKAKSGKATQPKKASQMQASSEAVFERKLKKIGDSLNEIFHLAGHSIDSGTEAQTPLLEVLMIAAFLHNETERDSGHKISGLKFVCECSEGEHFMPLEEFHDHCG